MKWCFENSALEDLANISFYEMRYAESVDEACLRADHIIDDIVCQPFPSVLRNGHTVSPTRFGAFVPRGSTSYSIG